MQVLSLTSATAPIPENMGTISHNGSAAVLLNRKATKIEYLSQENSQLREQISELQEILKLNKDALRIATHFTPLETSFGHDNSFVNNKNNMSVLSNNNNNNANMNSLNGNTKSTNSENGKAMSFILQALHKENETLVKINERLIEERNIAQSKALVNEQISEASEKHEKELLFDLEDKVRQLSDKVKAQEQVIYTYEKTIPDYDEISGIVVKYRDVINLNDQTVRMHDENEKLNQIIVKQLRELKGLRSSKEQLAKINLVKKKMIIFVPLISLYLSQIFIKQMSNEIWRLQAALATPLGRASYSQNFPQPLPGTFKDPKQIIKIHKKLMENDRSDGDDDDDSDDQDDNGDEFDAEMAPLPDKVETLNTEACKPPGITIPKLDLAKALKIQEINAKKSTMQQMQKQQGSDINAVCAQLKKVDTELTIAKKNLQREMLYNKTLSLENENLQRFCSELEGRNEILIQSHQLYEDRWKQIFQAFSFYRDFYKSAKAANSTSNNCTLFSSFQSSVAKSNQMYSSPSGNKQVTQLNTLSTHKNRSCMGIDALNSSCQYSTTLNRYTSNHCNQPFSNLINSDEIPKLPSNLIKMYSNNWNNNNVEIGQYMNRSMIDPNNFEFNFDEEALGKSDSAAQKELARNTLLSLAKDVYALFSPISSKKYKKEVNELKLKRSLSNVLDYMGMANPPIIQQATTITPTQVAMSMNAGGFGKNSSAQNHKSNFDRSDPGILYSEQQQQQQPQYKELNEVLGTNQEILIQFSENNEEKKGNQQYYSEQLDLKDNNKKNK